MTWASKQTPSMATRHVSPFLACALEYQGMATPKPLPSTHTSMIRAVAVILSAATCTGTGGLTLQRFLLGLRDSLADLTPWNATRLAAVARYPSRLTRSVSAIRQ